MAVCGALALSVTAAYGLAASTHFETLPPNAVLPSDTKCRQMIAPIREKRPQNTPFNYRVPTTYQVAEFQRNPVYGEGPPVAAFLRVNGSYTGTTDMILRWAACKWGIDEDVVRAQAWTESKWIQGGPNQGDGAGDRREDRRQCIRQGFNVLWNFECANCCYQSWGILQTKVYYAAQTWPMIKDSTAFNADYRYAEQRACMNGGFSGYFASKAQQPNTYQADVASGDIEKLLWGCVGMHYSGSWYDNGALGYIQTTKRNKTNKPWLQLN